MITDGLSPITVLLFVGAVLAAVALTATYVFARVTKRAPLAKLSLGLLVGGAGGYVLLLVGGSLASHGRVLAVGEEKHICEVDCHLAYSVAAAKAESVGAGLVRHMITVKVRFDEATISPRRSQTATLTPNSRYVALVDAQGKEYRGSTDGLRRALAPGESYTTDISFDVPADAGDVRLVLRNADPETRVLIGHENSILHAKTTFRLPG